MAAFAFVMSMDGSPLPLSPSRRAEAISTLQERDQGVVQEQETPGTWAAFSGSSGDMTLDGNRLLLVDGFPRTGEGVGGKHLLAELSSGYETDSGRGPRDLSPILAALRSVEGSFAACLHDASSGDVFLFRDRTGTRPIYYAVSESMFMVASECKVLQALGLPLHIDPHALTEAIIHRYLTGTACLLAPAVRVPEATVIHIQPGRAPRTERFWRLEFHRSPMSEGAFGEFEKRIENSLRTAVGKLVPSGSRVGILLSGGVDSSLLTAIAEQEVGPCVAFVGRIPGFSNVEHERAMKVAGHLGVEFRSVEIDTGIMAQDLPYIVRRVEELPRHLNNLALVQILRRAAEEVDVILQGDAADSLFGLELNRHKENFLRKQGMIRWIPRWAKRAAARFLEGVDIERAWDASAILAWEEDRYIRNRTALRYSAWTRKALGIRRMEESFWEFGDWPGGPDLDGSRRTHLMSTSIEGSLTRHDRLSRPLGLEPHAPFLAEDVMDVAAEFPVELCALGGSKPVLRSLCDRYLPQEVSRWSKAGFPIPQKEWLMGPLTPLFREAEASSALDDYLPSGFVGRTKEIADQEGMITALTLHLILEEFGLAGTAGR